MFGPRWEEHAERLVKLGRLRERGGRYLPRGPGYPAAEIALRSASPDSVAIVEADGGELIGTVESARVPLGGPPRAPSTCTWARPTRSRTSTCPSAARSSGPSPATGTRSPRSESETLIEQVREQRECCGVVALVRDRVGDRAGGRLPAEARRRTTRCSTCWRVDLPEQEFVTQALWYELPDELLREEFPLDVLQGSLHAAEHGQIAVLPLIAMCDRWDIGGLSTAFHHQTGRPTIFIYDGHPGGVGITRVGYERFERLVDDALRLISECRCATAARRACSRPSAATSTSRSTSAAPSSC